MSHSVVIIDDEPPARAKLVRRRAVDAGDEVPLARGMVRAVYGVGRGRAKRERAERVGVRPLDR